MSLSSHSDFAVVQLVAPRALPAQFDRSLLGALSLLCLRYKHIRSQQPVQEITHSCRARQKRVKQNVPAACLARMISATFSLVRANSVPDCYSLGVSYGPSPTPAPLLLSCGCFLVCWEDCTYSVLAFLSECQRLQYSKVLSQMYGC